MFLYSSWLIKLKKSNLNEFVFVIVLDSPAFSQSLIASNIKWFQDYLGGTSKDVTKEEFVTFIKKATDKKTPEYRQLYFFLLKCFQEGDVHKVLPVSITSKFNSWPLLYLIYYRK